MILSLAAIATMVYWIVFLDLNNQNYKNMQWLVTGSIFACIAVSLTASTIALYCRMTKLYKKGLHHESRLLRLFYVIFSVAYLTRVAINFTQRQ